MFSVPLAGGSAHFCSSSSSPVPHASSSKHKWCVKASLKADPWLPAKVASSNSVVWVGGLRGDNQEKIKNASSLNTAFNLNLSSPGKDRV